MSEEHNWIKAALALKYTRDSLAPFVADRIKQRHQHILEALGVVAGTHRLCRDCIDILLREHDYRRHKRHFRISSGRHWKCPMNICNRFFDIIVADHVNGRPNWSNTDPKEWCNDYWEYAQCYTRLSKTSSSLFRTVHTVEEYELSTLLSICLTNRCFLFDPEILEQCLAVRNQILHSVSFKVSDEQLSYYIEKMVALLENEHFVKDIAATQAVQRLQELRRHDFAINKNEGVDIKDEALSEMKLIKKETVELLSSETEKILAGETQEVKSLKENRTTTYIAPKKDTSTLTEGIAYRLIQEAKEITGQQSDVAEIRSCVETLLDKMRHIEIHQTGLAGSEEEYDSNMRETTQLFRELLGQNLLKTDVEVYSDSGFPDSVSTMSTQFQDDEVSLVEESVIPTTSDCQPRIEEAHADDTYNSKEPSEEGVLELLHAVDDTETSKRLGKNGLLDGIELNKLCSSEGRTSTFVKKECKKICAAIKAESDQIVHVFPAFKLNDEAKVVFVVFVEIEIVLHLPWTLEVRVVHQYSDESRIAMYCEENVPLSTETSRTIEDIIDKYSVKLMRNHTYLSAISASSVVSRYYGTTNRNIVPGPCIVLSVLVKHFIPINEEPFPTTLDGITVDVREGGVRFCGGSADDFHDQLRMGCKITSTFQHQKHGTLGGFVEHQEYGLCGVTCAHVVLDDKQKLDLKEKAMAKENDLNSCEIFQPYFDPLNRIGRLVEVTYKEGGNGIPGVDIALFKIEQRPPTEGNFPDYKGTTTTINYESGKVWGKAGLPFNQRRVQKFGFVTELTYGEIQFANAAVREFPFHSDMNIKNGDTVQKITTTLFKQYHIKSNNATAMFSKLGDSGALVFMNDDIDSENGLRCIGMVVGVLNDNTCAVTPITAILEELQVTQLKPFTPIISWKKIDARLTEMEERMKRMEERVTEGREERMMKEMEERMMKGMEAVITKAMAKGNSNPSQ